MVFESPDTRSTARDNSVDATRLVPVVSSHADHADATRVAHPPAADSEATRIARDARLVDLQTEGTRICHRAPAVRLAPATEQEVPERYQIGEKIGGRYEVLAIHRGTMGVVYGTFDHTEKLPRALKTLQQRHAGDRRMRDLFAAEALTWVKLEKHPFIVRAYLVERFDAQPYVITEYIRGQENMGGDLRSWLGHPKMTLPIAVEMALQIAQGMQHAAHKVPGLLHRDLKPANILVDERARAMVTDFGLVHAEEAGAGTPAYMAPEQWRAEPLDGRTDIYAYGCILYEMFTGHRMYVARSESEWETAHLTEVPVSPTALNSGLPPQIAAFIVRCLAKKCEHRPADWDEVVLECARWFHEITGQPVVFDFAEDALSADELLSASYSLGTLEKYPEMLEVCDRVLAVDATSVAAWYNKGIALLNLKRCEEALSANDRALELDASMAAASTNRGIALNGLKRYEEALAEFGRALALDVNDAISWTNKGVALKGLKRHEEALSASDRALALDINLTAAWYGKASALLSLEHIEEALSAYDRAIALNANLTAAWYGKGIALNILKRYEEALSAYDRALSLDASNAGFWHEKSIALRNLKRHEEALSAYERARALDPNTTYPGDAKGPVLQLSTLSEGAIVKGVVKHISEYGAFIDLDGIDGLLHITDLAWRRVKHPSEVLAVGDEITAKVLKVDTEKNRVSLGLKQLCDDPWVGVSRRCSTGTRLVGEVAMVADYGAYVEVEPGVEGLLHRSDIDATSENVDPSTVLKVGDQVEVMILDVDEGRRRFSVGMKQCVPDPQDVFTRELENGNLLAEDKRYEEAISAYDKALSINPNHPNAWFAKGNALLRLDRYDEALFAYGHATPLDTGGGVSFITGFTLLKLKRYAESISACDRALEINPSLAAAQQTRTTALQELTSRQKTPPLQQPQPFWSRLWSK